MHITSMTRIIAIDVVVDTVMANWRRSNALISKSLRAWMHVWICIHRTAAVRGVLLGFRHFQIVHPVVTADEREPI